VDDDDDAKLCVQFIPGLFSGNYLRQAVFTVIWYWSHRAVMLSAGNVTALAMHHGLVWFIHIAGLPILGRDSSPLLTFHPRYSHIFLLKRDVKQQLTTVTPSVSSRSMEGKRALHLHSSMGTALITQLSAQTKYLTCG